MTSAQLKESDYDIDVFNRSQTAKIVSIRKKQLDREKQKKQAKATVVGVVKAMALVFIFVAMLSLIIFKNSMVSEAKYNIFNMKAEIKSLNTQVEELNAQIEQKTELKNIEKIAIEELKMQYPSKAQIVYIDASQKFVLADQYARVKANAMADSGIQAEDEKHTNAIKDIVTALLNTNN